MRRQKIDTTGLWTFADVSHPVYTRPPEATDWEFGDKRFTAPDYLLPETPKGEEKRTLPATESLRMDMVGSPSVTVYQHSASQNTVQMVRLNTQYMNELDLDEIRPIVRLWWELLRAMSQGTLDTKDLRKADNPYGYGPPPSKIKDMKKHGKLPPARTWELLKYPRRIPTQAKRHFPGIRGSVANRDIINSRTGTLYEAWRHTIVLRRDGVTLLFWNQAKAENGAPYPWFLFHGTIYMQAHGPWGVVAQRLLPRLHAAWVRAAREAQQRTVRRAQAMAMLVGEEAAAMTETQVLEAMI